MAITPKAVEYCESYFEDEPKREECKRVFEILEGRYIGPPPAEERRPWGSLEKETQPTEVVKALERRYLGAINREYDENPITKLSGGEDFLQDYLSLPRTSRLPLSKEELEAQNIFDTKIDFSKFAEGEAFFVPTRVMEILGEETAPWYDLEGKKHDEANFLEQFLGTKLAPYSGDCRFSDAPQRRRYDGDKPKFLACGSHYSELATPPSYNRNYIMVQELDTSNARKPIYDVLGDAAPDMMMAAKRYLIDEQGYRVNDDMVSRAWELARTMNAPPELWNSIDENGMPFRDVVLRKLLDITATAGGQSEAERLGLLPSIDYEVSYKAPKRVKLSRITEKMEKFVKDAETWAENRPPPPPAPPFSKQEFEAALANLYSNYPGSNPAMNRLDSEYTELKSFEKDLALYILEAYEASPATYESGHAFGYEEAGIPYSVLRLAYLGYSGDKIIDALHLVEKRGGVAEQAPVGQKFPLLKAKDIDSTRQGDTTEFRILYTEPDALGGRVDKVSRLKLRGNEASYFDRAIIVANDLKKINKDMTGLLPLGETPVRMTISNSPWDQLTKSGKCFGRGWDSCEMPTGAFAEGVFEDVALWNGVSIFRWGDLNKKNWDGRIQLRWCNNEKGTRDIGIEERLYPQGDSPHPFEMAIVPYLKDKLKEKGYLDYKLCVTPYKKTGYDDMMHGWVAGKGFSGPPYDLMGIYDVDNDVPTPLYFGDTKKRERAFSDWWDENRDEEEEEEEDEDSMSWESWWDGFYSEYSRSAVLRNDNPSPYDEYYVTTRNLASWASNMDTSGFEEDRSPENTGWDDIISWLGYTEVDQYDEDYMNWGSYPEYLNTFAEKLSDAGIEALAVTRPATSVDATPITDVHFKDAWFDFVADTSGKSQSFNDEFYAEMQSPLSDFEDCASSLSLTARERRQLERWPERKAEVIRPQILKCAQQAFVDIERAKTTRSTPIPRDVDVEVFDDEFVKRHDVYENGQPGPLFSICAVIKGKYPVSSKWSTISPKDVSKATRDYLRNALSTEAQSLLTHKCSTLSDDEINSVRVKSSRQEAPIHAFNPFSRRASETQG